MENIEMPSSKDDLILTISFLSPGYLLALMILYFINRLNLVDQSIKNMTSVIIAAFLVIGLVGSLLMYAYSSVCLRIGDCIVSRCLGNMKINIAKNYFNRIKKTKFEGHDFDKFEETMKQIDKGLIKSFYEKWEFEIYSTNPSWMNRIRRHHYMANCYFSFSTLFLIGTIAFLTQNHCEPGISVVLFIFSSICIVNTYIHSKAHFLKFFVYGLFTKSKITHPGS